MKGYRENSHYRFHFYEPIIFQFIHHAQPTLEKMRLRLKFVFPRNFDDNSPKILHAKIPPTNYKIRMNTRISIIQNPKEKEIYKGF